MTFSYLKVVKSKNLDFAVLSFWAGTLITYTNEMGKCFDFLRLISLFLYQTFVVNAVSFYNFHEKSLVISWLT